MRYPGGKGAMGAAQHIINQMPPHQDCYVELFLGSGRIMRTKRPAIMNIGIDLDEDVVAKFPRADVPGSIIECRCALSWLRECMRETKHESLDMLIYADPPYLPETLKSRQRYKKKFTRNQHIELLELLKCIHAKVIISGYRSKLYKEMIGNWRTYDFRATGRDGKSHVETIWMNYPEPVRLHDYRFIGNNYRERESISRRIKRNTKRIASWPIQQQYALMRSLGEAFKEKDF